MKCYVRVCLFYDESLLSINREPLVEAILGIVLRFDLTQSIQALSIDLRQTFIAVCVVDVSAQLKKLRGDYNTDFRIWEDVEMYTLTRCYSALRPFAATRLGFWLPKHWLRNRVRNSGVDHRLSGYPGLNIRALSARKDGDID